METSTTLKIDRREDLKGFNADLTSYLKGIGVDSEHIRKLRDLLSEDVEHIAEKAFQMGRLFERSAL